MKSAILALSLGSLISMNALASWRISDPQLWVGLNKDVGSITPQASNNNVSIELFDSKLFMVWRSSKDHFASANTVTYVAYSENHGATWTKDLEFSTGADVREGLLKVIGGKLHLYYFEGGTKSTKFDPKHVMHRVRDENGHWSEPVAISGPKEVLWELKENGDKVYKLSYQGPHYRFIPGILNVKFEETTDGETWAPADQAKDNVVYQGGVSEVAIEFDDEGNLWGVGRNEDGDSTGFGAQIFTAKKGHLSEWTSLKNSLKIRYDSPRMFKHHGEIYLLSRRAAKKFDKGLNFLPFNLKRWLYLGLYSLGKIRTALFHLNRETVEFEEVFDLPSAGDNAYPSVVRTGENQFLVANYSSKPIHQDWSWIHGQKSEEGTQIYGFDLEWIPDGLEGAQADYLINR
jgi:hypothetical protein